MKLRSPGFCRSFTDFEPTHRSGQTEVSGTERQGPTKYRGSVNGGEPSQTRETLFGAFGVPKDLNQTRVSKRGFSKSRLSQTNQSRLVILYDTCEPETTPALNTCVYFRCTRFTSDKSRTISFPRTVLLDSKPSLSIRSSPLRRRSITFFPSEVHTGLTFDNRTPATSVLHT